MRVSPLTCYLGPLLFRGELFPIVQLEFRKPEREIGSSFQLSLMTAGHPLELISSVVGKRGDVQIGIKADTVNI